MQGGISTTGIWEPQDKPPQRPFSRQPRKTRCGTEKGEARCFGRRDKELVLTRVFLSFLNAGAIFPLCVATATACDPPSETSVASLIAATQSRIRDSLNVRAAANPSPQISEERKSLSLPSPPTSSHTVRFDLPEITHEPYGFAWTRSDTCQEQVTIDVPEVRCKNNLQKLPMPFGDIKVAGPKKCKVFHRQAVQTVSETCQKAHQETVIIARVKYSDLRSIDLAKFDHKLHPFAIFLPRSLSDNSSGETIRSELSKLYVSIDDLFDAFLACQHDTVNSLEQEVQSAIDKASEATEATVSTIKTNIPPDVSKDTLHDLTIQTDELTRRKHAGDSQLLKLREVINSNRKIITRALQNLNDYVSEL